jgi:hypothetical protein
MYVRSRLWSEYPDPGANNGRTLRSYSFEIVQPQAIERHLRVMRDEKLSVR